MKRGILWLYARYEITRSIAKTVGRREEPQSLSPRRLLRMR
jgi:hypothetical protein